MEKLRSELKSKLGQDMYKNWIEVLSLVKIKASGSFSCPNSFIANWIDRNYRDQIIESFNIEEIYIKIYCLNIKPMKHYLFKS